jgi:hypothetical protein
VFRTCQFCLVLLAVVGCGNDPDPLTIQFGPLPDGERRLPDHNVKLRSMSAIYRLEVASTGDMAVKLEVALAEGATEGMNVRFKGDTTLLPKGRETLTLVLRFPQKAGAFSADIVLTSPDLSDWSRTYQLRGEKVDQPLSGRYLFHSPSGVDLGNVQEGNQYKFNVSLKNEGDEPVTIDIIEPEDNAPIEMPGFEAGTAIESRGAMQVNGIVRIPDETTGDHFFAAIIIRSDAGNAPVIRVRVKGKIRREYSIQPPSLPPTSINSGQPTQFDITVRAAEDVDPFRITSVRGLEPYFELVTELPKESTKSVVLGLKVRKDAPAGVAMVRGAVRVMLGKDEKAVEWPYQIRVLPPIFAQPSKLPFGTLDSTKMSQPVTREIRLVSTPGRKYKVTGVRAEHGRFEVKTIAVRGMPVRILVSLPAFAAAGNYVDRIVIETDDPDVPRLHIRVNAVVR